MVSRLLLTPLRELQALIGFNLISNLRYYALDKHIFFALGIVNMVGKRSGLGWGYGLWILGRAVLATFEQGTIVTITGLWDMNVRVQTP